ncbi:hypothetical protein BDN67DRAFT_1017000 [Paxillus ammoniavirescens]|nr:hypothetical protein BDN67DRAFT_1017000 [Paxillus ammoniavirescens]
MAFKPLIVTTKQKEVAISTCNCRATGSLDLNDYDVAFSRVSHHDLESLASFAS